LIAFLWYNLFALFRCFKMSLEIRNKWPIIAITVREEHSIQKTLIPTLPSRMSLSSAIINERRNPQSTEIWEKGTFIDLYI